MDVIKFKNILIFFQVRKYFTEMGIFEMEGPGNSPDLNPIEHLWQQMKVKIRKENPSTKVELISVIQKVWNTDISADYLKKLVFSMPRRLAAVIKANGGHTKY